VNWQFL